MSFNDAFSAESADRQRDASTVDADETLARRVNFTGLAALYQSLDGFCSVVAEQTHIEAMLIFDVVVILLRDLAFNDFGHAP